MPKLGLTMTEGKIRAWLVADGSQVEVGDPVLIVETDKVETEVEARDAGYLSISGVVGRTYACGDVIGTVWAEGEAPPVDEVERAERVPASPRARAAAREAGVDVAVIAGTGPGGRVVADDVVRHLDGPAPAPQLFEAPAPETPSRVFASPRARAVARDLEVDVAAVSGSGPAGRVVAADVTAFAAERKRAAEEAERARVAEEAERARAAEEAERARAAEEAERARQGLPAGSQATAAGRMLAELLGVDLAQVSPSNGSRITRDDVAGWVRKRLASQPAEAPVPDAQTPLSGKRAIIAERMHASLTEMAQLTLTVDADMTAVNEARARLRDQGATVPGYTAWVVAAASRSLLEHPGVNSTFDDTGLTEVADVHIGVAVALDDGLIVPVIRDAPARSVEELHVAVADLANRARDGKLAVDEIEGGTFSVTALGMYGVDVFTPIVNPPNTAILGVGRLRTETRWTENTPSPTTVMTLSLTWDHRAFDGAPAAEFAQSIVRHLENPAQLEL